MRHDYDLPPDWEAKSDEEKDQWFKQERARRQAARQGLEDKQLQKEQERVERKIDSRPGFVKVSEYR